MVLELARPVALLFSILSLLGVFHSAFLEPTGDVEQRLVGSVGPLLLAAGIAFVGGLTFQARWRTGGNGRSEYVVPLIETFPVRIFCWSVAGMAVLFLLSWYIEAHCIFYRDIRS
jgi:hypothetical protein